MKRNIIKEHSKTSKIAFWLSTVLFVIVILNLIYGYLLQTPKLAGVVPASSAQLIEALKQEGENIELLLATVNNHLEDIDRYVNNIRERGNIFHSTTLGIFVVDTTMADYIFSHQQFSDKTVAVNSDKDSDNLKISNVIKYDINMANNKFRNALLSRNPIRWRRMVEAKLVLEEIQHILSQRVGERVYAKSLTYKLLKETQ